MGQNQDSVTESKKIIAVDHIHYKEYPNDNYSHILGINDVNHAPSKLQSITASRIKDTIRNKTPIDTVIY